MQYRMTHMPVAHMYPKGTYRKKIYYPRGDDIYKEPEWTENEKRNLTAKYKVALKEYLSMKNEYQAIESQLRDVDKCTLQIAERLGEESNSTTESAELRQQIKDLSQNFNEVQHEIEAIRAKTNPTSISYLLKELALFMPEFEANDVDKNIASENVDNFEHAICELTASDEYQRSVWADAEYRVSIQCKNDLKRHLQTIQKSINEAPSGPNSELVSSANAISQEKSDIFALSEKLVELKLNKEEIILQKELAATHKRLMIKTAVDEIAELNDFLVILGEEPVDLEEVKENCNFSQIELEEKEIAEKEEKLKQERNDRPLTKKRNRPSTTKQTMRNSV